MPELVADLQLHSSASDGSDPPAQVVRRARALKFAAIALTDHDTMAGVPEALATAESLGIECIQAVELSTLDQTERQVDILGYGIDHHDEDFAAELTRIRSGRLGRAHAMVQKLNEMGYPVSWERVQAIAGSENVGRPHVAKAMVEARIVPNINAAFTPELIGDGGRAYVQRVKISPEDAIERIHRAGGVACAAHPARTKLTDAEIEHLVAAGLDALEVYYPQHTASDTRRFEALVARYSLLTCGGSDDHGDINEGRLMGTIRLPYRFVEQLYIAIAERQSNARGSTR
ncbi:MAG TPA: PHP domain-containing protein [Gemmatimonadaceae bacterium]|nr:PHP domain-containing protein [Gemmatimonadaceae bacterium]